MVETRTQYGEFAACNAPFNNMYITLTGRVSPCWKLPGWCDQWSRDRSLMDIWQGEHFQRYRDALQENRFLARCSECKKEIDDGVWPLAKAYSGFPVNANRMPSLMEIELSNQCNLECIMCNGNLSSGIRKNRDKLPPLPQIFDDSFLDQMRDFIPHLTELRVNGGEPLAQKILLDLLDVVSELAPDLHVNIATNGTVYNKRVAGLMERCNIHFNVSIDSLREDRYREIRINGELSTLLKNLDIFRAYMAEKDAVPSIMVNPMRQNWDEMVSFAQFCDDMNCSLSFNTILYPSSTSIRNMSTEELKHVLSVMREQMKSIEGVKKWRYDPVDHLVNNQIETWYQDSLKGLKIQQYDDKGQLIDG